MTTPAPTGISYLMDLSSQILAPLEMTLLVFVFTLFMLLEREQLRNRLLSLAGRGQINVMTQMLDDAAGFKV